MTMTTSKHRPDQLPAWHSTFSACADLATSTVYARGTLDLFTVDLFQGAVDVLLRSGRVDITLDLTGVSSVDHAAAWCIARLRADLASQGGGLSLTGAGESVRPALGDLGDR